jgi:succinoglycan biosynthesis transport protein ExoP
MTEAFENRPTTVADYLAILRRRKWILLLPPIVAAVLAYVVSAGNPAVYQASARILVDRTQVLPASTGVPDPCAGDPTRCLTTLARSADTPALAQRVASQISGMTADRVLGDVSVTPATDADLLEVAAQDGQPEVATTLANTFAREFTVYTTERQTARIEQALEVGAARLNALSANGQRDSAEYQLLAQQRTQLQISKELIGNQTSINQLASGAQKVSPRPKRDAVLAGLLGIVLGLGLAFLAEALDRHVRSEHELEEALGLPLLARIPKPPRKLQKTNDLVMLKEPGSVDAEMFRKLRTSMEFVSIDGSERTIMVTSPVAKEGKSTTVANLAIALARAQRNVVLVDLDLRAPFVSRLFHVGSRPGITDVAVHRASLTEALRPIALTPLPIPAAELIRTNGASGPDRTNGKGQVEGLLHILPAGTIPPSADEMLQDARVTAVLKDLAERFDVVLVDAPPMLAFGDAMTLSAHVDAIFAVVRLGKVQRPILHEFARQLAKCHAKRLGYVVTGVEHSDSYRYLYEGYAYDARLREEQATRAGERV